jgi:leucyl/phenylalanyl-tRNA--protein transferase
MAEGRNDPRLFIVDPDFRGILPLDRFHVPRRLARLVRDEPYDIRTNTAFAAVVEACAEASEKRLNTWINTPIQNLYCALHRAGCAHSVECWIGDRLVGGLYGVAIGGAFFGESMFSRMPNASKIALVHLVARLRGQGFRLLDTQFVTDHLKQFGAIEVARETYHELLSDALEHESDFGDPAAYCAGPAALQLITQTS